jgi:hypothetical protein
VVSDRHPLARRFVAKIEEVLGAGTGLSLLAALAIGLALVLFQSCERAPPLCCALQKEPDPWPT